MKMAQAFNEWMRRFTDEPERFAREFQTCGEFLAQEANGEEPTYGAKCEAYLTELMAERSAAGAVALADTGA